jgi:hypothetical protein
MATDIDTKAVAMIELLMGFSAEPMNMGVRNRHPNAVSLPADRDNLFLNILISVY